MNFLRSEINSAIPKLELAIQNLESKIVELKTKDEELANDIWDIVQVDPNIGSQTMIYQ